MAAVEGRMRNLLFQALDSAGDGAFIVDERQRIVFWNQAAESTLGHTSGEIQGRTCYAMLKGQDAHGRVICRRYCQVATRALAGRRIATFDMRVLGKPRDPLWINVSTFLFGVNGQAPDPLIVHLFRDATRWKRKEELLHRVLSAARRLQDEQPFHPASQARTVPADVDLTDREREVLFLLVRGSSTDDIAKALVISTATVRNHIRNIMRKFQVHSRLQIVLYALKNGLASLD
jgi:PAS domain S-box-containing protein